MVYRAGVAHKCKARYGVFLFLGGVGVLINESVEMLKNALRCLTVSSAERVIGYGGV